MAAGLAPGASAAHGHDGSVHDLVQLARELLAPSVIHPRSLERATSVAFPGLAGVLPGFGPQDPCDWGLGFEMRGAQEAPLDRRPANDPATFGHFGRSGRFLWVDPVAGVACAVQTDRDFGPWAMAAWPAVSDGVLAEVAALRARAAEGRGELAPLTVAVDATPLLGRPTGVGAFCAGALGGLAGRPDLAVAAFAVSWRRRHGIAALVPDGVAVAAGPCRPDRSIWPGAGSADPRSNGSSDRSTSSTPRTSSPRPPEGGRRRDRARPHPGALSRAVRPMPPCVFPELIRRALRRGAWVHTPSAFVAGEVIDAFGADPGRVRAVHSGVPALRGSEGGGAPPVPALGGRPYCWPSARPNPAKTFPDWCGPSGRWPPIGPDVALVLAGPAGVGRGRARRAAIATSPVAAGCCAPAGWTTPALGRLSRGGGARLPVASTRASASRRSQAMGRACRWWPPGRGAARGAGRRRPRWWPPGTRRRWRGAWPGCSTSEPCRRSLVETAAYPGGAASRGPAAPRGSTSLYRDAAAGGR